MQNTAFVFLKPHANFPTAQKVVKDTFEKKGIKVLSEGEITGEEIDKNQYIDNHYYAIASKATILQPSELNIPKEKFKATFGVEWDECMAKGIVFNAKGACEELGVDGEGLDKIWAVAKKEKKLVKFGGGFYCAKLEVSGKTIYAFNGFFMSMRGKYVAPGTSVHYFVVEFNPKELSWEDFRGSVLGPTDPADAPADSLRGMFLANWEQYGLKSVPNVGDNAVHASASPFEALAERMNWLQMDAKEDAFGAKVLEVIGEKKLKEWSVDPQVTYGPVPITKSAFDTLEDTNSDYCLALLQMMSIEQ